MPKAPLTPGTYGTIQQRGGGDGQPFVARVTYRERDTGIYRDVTAQADTAPKAETKLKAKLLNLQNLGGDEITAQSKVRALAEAWFKLKSAEKDAGAQTLTAYRRTLDRHVIPQLGNLEIFRLNVTRINTVLMDLTIEAPTEARRSKTILRGIVSLGVGYEAIRFDFMRATFKIPSTEYNVRILSRKDLDRVFYVIDWYRTAPGTKGPKPDGQLGQVFRIMLGAGLRIGEGLALQKQNIHEPTEPGRPWLLSVTGTIITPNNGPTFRQPKTKTKHGMRTVPVPTFVAEVLAARLGLVADVDNPEQLLFIAARGRRCRRATFVAPGGRFATKKRVSATSCRTPCEKLWRRCWLKRMRRMLPPSWGTGVPLPRFTSITSSRTTR